MAKTGQNYDCATKKTEIIPWTQEAIDADATNKIAVASERAADVKVQEDKDAAILRLIEKSKTDENARDYLLAIDHKPHADAVEVPK